MNTVMSPREVTQKMMNRLRYLTDIMPDHNPSFDLDNKMHLETLMGDAVSEGILSHQHVSIALTTLSEDTILLSHYHPEVEIISVLEGELTLTFIEDDGNNRDMVLKQYECLIIPPMIEHFCSNSVKTVVLAQLMPHSNYFPMPSEK